MNTSNASAGVMDTIREVAPALSGNTVAVWDAAKHGTQRLGDAMPETMGLDHVKHFIQRHPMASTCIALGVAYYFMGGRLFGRR